MESNTKEKKKFNVFKKDHSRTDSSTTLTTENSNNSTSNLLANKQDGDDINNANVENIELTDQSATSASVRNKEENSIRNILLIGRTGNGKSTLANVLTGTNEFKEGEFAVSETKKTKSVEFEYEGEKYRVVDTIGISDTKLTPEEVIEKLVESCWHVSERISQILFVTRGRFTEEEKLSYDKLREVIFDKGVVKYITIVRTDFTNFRNEEKCQEDIKLLKTNDKELAEIINSCRGIVYVNNPNNPPINVDLPDDYERDLTIKLSELVRSKSRKILLDHFKECCKEVYNVKHFYKRNCENFENFIKEREKKIDNVTKRKIN